MKSLERTVISLQSRHPFLSSYTIFAVAVTGGRYAPKVIRYWFNRLVDKDDYCQSDRNELYIHLDGLSEAEQGMK